MLNVIRGQIPDNNSWRVMVLLSQGCDPAPVYQIGAMLARANQGELFTVGLVDEVDATEDIDRLQVTLDTVRDEIDSGIVLEQAILVSKRTDQTLAELVEQASIDLVLVDIQTPLWQHLDRLTCAVATLRSDRDMAANLTESSIRRILIPTAGGPNTIHALQILQQIPAETAIDALYVSRTIQDENGVALGHARLNSMLEVADSSHRVSNKVIEAMNPIQGIVAEASGGYDLVIVGASQESSIDKALFGDVVTQVVRDSRVPVLVVRSPNRPARRWLGVLDLRLQNIAPRLQPEERQQVYVDIYEQSRPDLDYYVLITASAALASFGLILNSPAVVIGAMLVAPLMSPIIATGLSLVLGDGRFLRFAIGSALRGIIVALVVGYILGFLPGNNVSAEVAARTAPTLVDLGVAFVSGVAAAFALSYRRAAAALPGVAIAAALVPPLTSVGIAFAEGEWRMGLGALLLFTTNYVMITLAAGLVFLVFGFRPNLSQKEERRTRQRSLRIFVLGAVLIIAALTPTTYNLIQNELRVAEIERSVDTAVSSVLGGDSVGIVTDNRFEDPLTIYLTIQAEEEPNQEILRQLQQMLSADLAEPVRLTILFERVSIIDP